MKQSRVFFWSVWFIATLLLPVKAADQIYYDIDFSSPLHTVGQTPATGSSIHTPSRISFGQPVVNDAMGPLQDQPLVLNCYQNSPTFFYDQIQLDMLKGSNFYFISFDVATQNLIGSHNAFTIFLDMPNALGITFYSSGILGVFGLGQGLYYQDNQAMHFDIMVDILQKNLSVMIDQDEVYNNVLNFNEIHSIRFSHGLNSMSGIEDSSSYVGIDNIVVANYVIPEPATLSLFALGGLAILRKRK